MIFKRIYLDNASATPLDKEVLEIISKTQRDFLGNPNALHQEGILIKREIEQARQKVAEIAGVKKEEIIYTSGGTESNNLAILGYLKTFPKEMPKKVITSSLEHSSVLKTLESVEKEFNLEIVKLKSNQKGFVDLEEFEKTLDSKTVLVSFMYVNNEIGTINPIKELSSRIKKFKFKNQISDKEYPFLHSDASQAPLFLDINLNRLGAHLITVDGTKISGPKGSGILIKKSYVPMQNIFYGGGQEFDLRPGTENVSGILGISKALQIANLKREKTFQKNLKLQNYFLKLIKKEIPKAILVGDLKNRIPNNLNICIQGLNSELATIQLDELGIACSPMTTCKNLSETTRSYVIDEIMPDCGSSSLRFSWNRNNTKFEIWRTVRALKKVVEMQNL